jgi:cytochrome c553
MKTTMHSPLTVVAILLVLAPTLAQGQPLTQQIQAYEQAALFPSTEMINTGRNVAESICASCHGMEGISDNKGTPSLAGQRAVYLYRAQQAFQTSARDDATKKHNGFLTDEALLAVAAYYASLPPAFNAEALDSAEALEEDPFLSIRDDMKRCIKCHGETGSSEGSGIPSLTAQSPEYFENSMLAYLDGSRSHNLMKRFVSSLETVAIKEMGVFYAVQEPLLTQTQGEGDVNVGRRLSQDCQSCHGADGNAKNASMPTLAGQDAKYFVKAMNQYKDNKRQHEKMFEAAEQLSEQDMKDLATYYAAQQPLRRNVRAPLKSAEWIRRCERCHGIDGNSSDPRFPMLAGQDLDYLVGSLEASAAVGRNNTTMHAMSERLSSLDIERIAVYFASKQPRAVVYIQLPCGDDALQ